MKQKIKLTESEFKGFVGEMVKKTLKKINEGILDHDADERWERAKEMIGSDTMLEEVCRYFSNDEIIDFLDSLERAYEINMY